jgi:hypothetical protein
VIVTVTPGLFTGSVDEELAVLANADLHEVRWVKEPTVGKVQTMTVAVNAAQKPVVPPVLYVPVEDPWASDELTIEFRWLADGRLALVAYTALDRLVNGCGPHQPWAIMPTTKLDEIDLHQPYDVILLDVEIPEHQRRKASER